MAETTHLYLMVFPDKQLLKVGKANDIFLRGQTLKRWWGAPDYGQSYHLKAPEALIFKLEKALHLFLDRYTSDEPMGDGKTEIFSLDALDRALAVIEMYRSDAGQMVELKKGVELPVVAVTPIRVQKRLHERLTQKSAKVSGDAVRLVQQFGRINRLLIMLHRRQGRIAYEYDITDEAIHFRVRLNEHLQGTWHPNALQDYFDFRVDSLSGSTAVRPCTADKDGDLVQFDFRRYKVDRVSDGQTLLAYLAAQSEILLNRLPKRSAAAQQPVPLRCLSEVFRERMRRGR